MPAIKLLLFPASSRARVGLRLAIVVGVSVFYAIAHTEAATITVKPLNYQGKIPYIDAIDQRIASRINNAIYLRILTLVTPVKWQGGLKEKQISDGLQPISDVSYAVGRHNARVLALALSADDCGAYCETTPTILISMP